MLRGLFCIYGWVGLAKGLWFILVHCYIACWWDEMDAPLDMAAQAFIVLGLGLVSPIGEDE